METPYLILMICLLVVVLWKQCFYIFALAWSFMYFRILHRKGQKVATNKQNHYAKREASTDIGVNNTGESLKAKLLRHLLGLRFYAILRTGKIPSHIVRNMLYRHVFGIRMGKHVVIYGGAYIKHPDNLSIGKGSIIGHSATLSATSGIEIGENVNFSTGVQVWSRQHSHRNYDFSCDNYPKIVIGNRAWLGPNVIVLPGCNIGEGAVIGAGAVVTKDIEPFSINVGIPAKKVGERNRELTYEFEGAPVPFM